jgi:membrane-associated phospholipid phosphatase
MVAICAVLGLALTTVALADELEVDRPRTIAVTATAAAGLLGTELLKSDLAPSTCHWCDRASDGSDTLNGLDRSVRNALRWSDPQIARTASTAVGLVIVPLAATALDLLAARDANAQDQVIDDVLVIAEAASSAGLLTQAVKFPVGRERPFVHALPPDQRAHTANPSDNNTSFFSGHTAIAFAVATSSGMVAHIRGYRLEPFIWATGFTLATATAYLRIAADDHYLTDVTVAAATGVLVGWAMPRLLHTKHAPIVSLGCAGGPGVTLTWLEPW